MQIYQGVTTTCRCTSIIFLYSDIVLWDGEGEHTGLVTSARGSTKRCDRGGDNQQTQSLYGI